MAPKTEAIDPKTEDLYATLFREAFTGSDGWTSQMEGDARHLIQHIGSTARLDKRRQYAKAWAREKKASELGDRPDPVEVKPPSDPDPPGPNTAVYLLVMLCAIDRRDLSLTTEQNVKAQQVFRDYHKSCEASSQNYRREQRRIAQAKRAAG